MDLAGSIFCSGVAILNVAHVASLVAILTIIPKAELFGVLRAAALWHMYVLNRETPEVLSLLIWPNVDARRGIAGMLRHT